MDDFDHFVTGYYDAFIDALRTLDRRMLREILRVMEAVAERGATLWVAGNGGSAALSDHAACEISKWTHRGTHPPIRTISLASNGPMLTAIANDVAYEKVFSKQLEYCLREGDAVLLISTSGNSPNVLEACRYAQGRGVPTIAFVGFDGGQLAQMADRVMHVKIDNCGIAEDAHQSLIHVLTQYIAKVRDPG